MMRVRILCLGMMLLVLVSGRAEAVSCGMNICNPYPCEGIASTGVYVSYWGSQPYYMSSGMGNWFYYDASIGCKIAEADKKDMCGLVAEELQVSSGCVVVEEPEEEASATLKLSRLLLELPDQIMGLLLCFLCFKTFVGMVK